MRVRVPMTVLGALMFAGAFPGCAGSRSPTQRSASVEAAPPPVTPSPADETPNQPLAQALEQETDSSAPTEEDPTVLVDMTAPVVNLVPPLTLDLPASASNRYSAEPGRPTEGETGPPTVKTFTAPALSRNDVANVIRGHVDGLAACYDTGRLANPSLEGRIDFAWTINPDGTVRDVRIISSQLDDASTEACMTRVIESWRFPPPQGGPAIITFPFKFRPINK